MPGITASSGKGTLLVAAITIRVIELVAVEGGRVTGDIGQHATQRVSEEVMGCAAANRLLQCSDELAVQTVLVQAALAGTIARIGVFFQSKGIDCHGGRRIAEGTYQYPATRGIVDGMFLVTATFPEREVVQVVIA